MKRRISLLLLWIMLMGCGPRVIGPQPQSTASAAFAAVTSTPGPVYTLEPTALTPTTAPLPVLATFAPRAVARALYPEELLSEEGDPIGAEIRSLIAGEELTKPAFLTRFVSLIQQIDDIRQSFLRLSDEERTLTADRKERTLAALQPLADEGALNALQTAYARCPGEGEALPVTAYGSAMAALQAAIRALPDRTVTYFDARNDTPREYMAVIAGYMGEPVEADDIFRALEELMQTEAYAISAALQMDPEAARKKEPIFFGGFAKNMAFLCQITGELCPLPDDAMLPMPREYEGDGNLNLFQLAYRFYPGRAFLKVYAAHAPQDQQSRWANAPEGYLQGLAVHNAYAVIPHIKGYGLDYLQYKWYEDMLDRTMTGMTALLIHHYGYSQQDLGEYLAGWGAKDFAGYLYEKAMSDPFDSLVAAYGYYRYLDICQAALSAGCPDEVAFLRDYLAAGPAPYAALKEYMVSLYQNRG